MTAIDALLLNEHILVLAWVQRQISFRKCKKILKVAVMPHTTLLCGRPTIVIIVSVSNLILDIMSGYGFFR